MILFSRELLRARGRISQRSQKLAAKRASNSRKHSYTAIASNSDGTSRK